MPTTTSGFRYPAATDAPDGPGAFFNLATDLTNYLAETTWTPGFGGGSGASLGSGGTTATGYATVHGKRVTYNGFFQFGTTGGVFGNATVTGLNVGGNVNVPLTLGTGVYQPAGGGNSRDLVLKATGGSTCVIYVDSASGLVGLNTLGTPNPIDQISFAIHAVLA